MKQRHRTAIGQSGSSSNVASFEGHFLKCISWENLFRAPFRKGIKISSLAIKTECILDALSAHVETQGETVAYTFLHLDGSQQTVNFRELDRRARQIASELLQRAEPGDRALLMYPSGLNFIEAFLGCLHAGIVAVPAYAPKKNRNANRITAIADDCRPSLLLGTSETERNVLKGFTTARDREMFVATDQLKNQIETSFPSRRSEELAFLQYTSGSTATPKGVLVSHKNIVANERLIEKYFDFTKSSIMVSWLPMFHDMGLIGGVLAPLFVGFPSVLMSPATFLRKPVKWLRAISEFGGTCTGAPNFAYDLCIKKIPDEEKAGLDLSSLTIAYNGAEPVRSSTISDFSHTFAQCGFKKDAFFPCYGMAETTLLVSGGPPLAHTNAISVGAVGLEQNQIIETTEGRPVVSCGQVGPDLEVRIVNVANFIECPSNDVGEIWVCGPSIASGYWNRLTETKQSFQAKIQGDDREWLRTGDLGFLRNGELYLTGRLKDLIIIRGRNLYPQDIEKVVEEKLPFVEPNSCVAFSIDNNDNEELVVVVEGTREMVRWAKSGTRDKGANIAFDAIDSSVKGLFAELNDQFGVAVGDLIFIRPTTFPRTSSGKLQRQLTKRMLAEGRLEVVFESEEFSRGKTEPNLNPSRKLTDLICKAIREWKGNAARLSISGDTTFASLGMDSLASVSFSLILEEKTGLRVEGCEVFQALTVNSLANHLHERGATDPADNPTQPNLNQKEQTTRILPLKAELASISAAQLFARYEELGFLYPAKRERLAPVYDSVKSNWAKLIESNSDLLRVYESGHYGDETAGWASICGWKTSAASWVFQHHVSTGSTRNSAACLMGIQQQLEAQSDVESLQVFYQQSNSFASRIYGSLGKSVSSENLQQLDLLIHSTPKELPTTTTQNSEAIVEVVKGSSLTRQAISFIRDKIGGVNADCEEYSNDLFLSGIDDAYRECGLARNRRVFAHIRDGTIDAICICYRGPIGLNFSFLENRCVVLVNKSLNPASSENSIRLLVLAAQDAYKDTELSCIHLAFTQDQAPTVFRMGYHYVRTYTHCTCKRAGFKSWQKHITSFFGDIVSN